VGETMGGVLRKKLGPFLHKKYVGKKVEI